MNLKVEGISLELVDAGEVQKVTLAGSDLEEGVAEVEQRVE